MLHLVKRILNSIGLCNSPIDRIRNGNPSCNIFDDVSLINTELGNWVSILNDTTLVNSNIGDYSYIGAKTFIDNVRIGKFCSIAPDVRIGLGKHPTRKFISTYPAFYSSDNGGCAKKIRNDRAFDDTPPETRIGHDVWIGANAIIPGGVVIGTGAVIAAGAVVIKDVEPYSIVGGNPAGLIRHRFTDIEREQLLNSEWWNWSIEFIEENVNEFLDISNLEKLMASIDKT